MNRSAQSVEIALSINEFVGCLRRLGRWGSLWFDILKEKIITEDARSAGLTVSNTALQRAADQFRYRHGLTSAEATQRWLAEQFLTVEDWEAGLEHELLVEKFKDHLLATAGEAFFRSHKGAFARIRLRRLVVATDGLARELLAQVREEGDEFAAIAAARTADPAAGDLGDIFRQQLSASVADAVFAAQPGDMVGPFHTAHGHELYQVGEQRPTELDAATAAVVREEVFATWLRDKMTGVRITLTGLDGA